MKTLLTVFILALSPLAAVYLFIFEEQQLPYDQKIELFELILKGEPPRIFYASNPIDLEDECHKLFPFLRLEWISPSVWQLGVLHAFFHDPMIRKGILSYCKSKWEPLKYEQPLHARLSSARGIEEIVSCFDLNPTSLSPLCELFFQVNKAVSALYNRAENSDIKMLHLAISELPPFCQWQEKNFPFWKSPWIYNPCSVENFYNALTDLNQFTELLKIEKLAHEKGEWVLYRGYSGSKLPSTIQFNHTHNHALSFGSTLLGGAFFSLEATAITYSKPETPEVHSFLALRVQPQELRSFFRVGPLHPFLQLLSDGEMFHAHTKIATKDQDEYINRPLDGYFMKCNKQCMDPVDYIINSSMTPKEFEKAFLLLCEKSGHVFLHD